MGICLNPGACLAEAAAQTAVGAAWDSLADSIATGAGEMVTQLFAWWTHTGSTPVDTPALHDVQRYVTAWLAVPVAVLALLATVTWGVAGGSPGWVRDSGRGLLVFGIVAAGSIPIVAALQAWAESLSIGLVSSVPIRDVGARFTTLLTSSSQSATLVMLWALVVLLVGAIEFVLMLFRDAAVLVLTVILPVAAAGQFTRSSLLWLPKVAGWLVAFLFVKPASALVYLVGFTLLGKGEGLAALVSGLCVLLTAVFAMPAMLRLVSFAVTAPSLSSGSLGTAATLTGIAASGAQIAATTAIPAAAPVGAAVTSAGRGAGRPARTRAKGA